jgi:hypothetical protein
MSNIFKLYINDNNNLSKLYLFIKNKYLTGILEESIETLQNKYYDSKEFIKSDIFNSVFKYDFSELDIKYINDFDINIYFVDENIYYDDTLEIIKFKFLKYYNQQTEPPKQISYEELYMYGLINKKYNPAEIYNTLSDNNSNKITSENLKQYLLNLNEQIEIFNKLLEINDNKEKDFYTFDDINSIELDEVNILTPIGQNINNKLPHLYTTNPFHLFKYSNYIRSIINTSLNTNNNSLLFEYNLVNNTMFLCFFDDVLNYTNQQSSNLEEDITIKLYFPMIASNQLTQQLFIKSKKTYISKTNKHVASELFVSKNTFTDTLYNVSNNKQEYPDLKYINDGAKGINLNIHTNINLSLSLESLFKLINSNIKIPLIKYNPGKKNENIYRLFTNKKTKANVKIPYLSKELIVKYSKLIGKNNTISMVIFSNNTFISDNVKLFLLELDIYGTINIKMEFFNHLSIEETEFIIRENVNPILDIIKKHINTDANSIQYFESLIDNNIELINLNYAINIATNMSIKLLNNIKNCLYLYFNIISDKATEKLYRYKRVSNYNEMNDKDAFIIELVKQKEPPTKIIQMLKDNFKLSSFEQATEIFNMTIQELSFVQNTFNYRKLKIKDSPGFLLNIDNNLADKISISIQNIDNIRYVYFMKLYIDSIFKLSFNESKNVDLTMCKSGKKKEQQFVNDITPDDVVIEVNQKNINDVLSQEKDIDMDDIIDASTSIGDEDDDYDNLMNIMLGLGIGDDDEDDDDDGIEDDVAQNALNDVDESEDDDIAEEIQDKPLVVEPEEKIKMDDEGNQDDAAENDNKKNFNEATRANPILGKLERLQPDIFKTGLIKKPNLAKENISGEFEAYSRICQSGKQPVILTEEEKDNVIRDNPNYKNTDILEYSPDPTKKNYYICPRFWDLKNNKTLTQKEVDSGEHGIIYKKGNGGNIYKFEDRDREPGFKKPRAVDANGNEFCLPCCFYKLKNEKTDNNRQICNVKKEDAKITEIKYVIRGDKFPLEQYKVGHLPLNVKKFLQFDSDKCINPDNNNLKYKYTCLLRYGVQNNQHNSFIACIADLYSKENNMKESITINEMKTMLVAALTIDNFIHYNNGNLLQIFTDKKYSAEFLDAIDIKSYDYKSKFYDKIDKENINQLNLYKRILTSFEQFKLYLKGNNYIIDYTYLWDIICKPNTKLFPNGINLIILDITTYDLTDNVKVICPKQNYSNEFIDDSKKSLILLKKNEYFEPVYSIKSELSDSIEPLFSFGFNTEETGLDEFKKVLNFIKSDLNDNCISNTSDETNKFKKNISLENIINILNKLKYEVNFQVVDYESKVIAVLVSNKEEFENYRYIPCYPSKMYEHEDIPIIFIDDLSNEYFAEYKKTKDFLEKIYTDSNQIIQCMPLNKIVEDELVVGILTNANQFVMLSEPALYINDELEILSDKNYLFTDTIIQNKFNIDEERREMINNIKLESGFYNSFRNTVLKLLSEYKNIKFNIRLQDIIKNNAIIYFDKIKLIREELESLVDNSVMFAQYDPRILNGIKNFSSCINNTNCDSDYCMVKADTNICNLIIPESNLITNDSNIDIYFTKIADEFARYNKTKMVLFNPSKFISFNNIKYNINFDEVIIMETALAREITTSTSNIKDPYSNFNTFDTNNINYSNNKVNKINPDNIDVEYTEFDLQALQPNQKVILKLAKEQIDKIKIIEAKYGTTDISNGIPVVNPDISNGIPVVNPDISNGIPVVNPDISNGIPVVNPDISNGIPVVNPDIDVEPEEQPNITENINDVECKHKKLAVKEKLYQFFKNKIYEFYFTITDNGLCSVELILYIIKHYYANLDDSNMSKLSGADIKNILIDEYFNHELTEALLGMFIENNKTPSMTALMKPYVDKIKTLPFEKTPEFKDLLRSIINNDDYIISYIDIYLLALKYELPIILVSNSIINSYINIKPYVIINKNNNTNNYYFIKLPSSDHRGLKNYKLLYYNNNTTIDITTQLIDSDKYNIKTEINEELKEYKDLVITGINKFNTRKIEPKNEKLLKNLNKNLNKNA